MSHLKLFNFRFMHSQVLNEQKNQRKPNWSDQLQLLKCSSTVF